MKTPYCCLSLIIGLLAAPVSHAFAVQESGSQTNGTDTILGIPKSHLAPLSAGINDVLKLAQSGVDESVIVTFVKNSQTAYRPSADEILKLKDAGVSERVITAMLQRGTELRQQSAQRAVASANQTPQTAPTVPQQPAPTYSAPVYAPAPTVVYANPYPVYTYPAYSYSYAYNWGNPYYYSYWPRTIYYGGFFPRVSVGFRFGGHGGFRGHFDGGHFGGRIGGGHFTGHIGGGFRGGFRR